MIHTQFHNHGQYPGVATIIPVEGTSYGTGRVRVSHLGGKHVFPSCFFKNKNQSTFSFLFNRDTL